MTRVLVTGCSLLCPLGLDPETVWQAALEGKSGVVPIERFDTRDLDTGIAGLLPHGIDELERTFIKRRASRQMTSATRMSVVAGRLAWQHAGLDQTPPAPDRAGITFGATGTGYDLPSQLTDNDNPQSFRILKNMPSAAPGFLAIALNARGPGFTLSTACSSSALAVAQGADLIRLGRADVILAGGGDSSVTREDIRGFTELLALSTRDCPPGEASCPFDARRDGFVMGEGAAFLVLESEDHARRRGAPVLAELAGSSVTTEAYNILSPAPHGDGMARTMTDALARSKVPSDEVDYINAHGTSTLLNDSLETRAIRTVFGPHADSIAVSSTKSMIGHTLAAAGAIEGAFTALSVNRGELHPTINLTHPDPDCDLDYVPREARTRPVRTALSNSFAFGGHNVTLVFRRC